jgi:valyl-tRNA synthetase
VEVLRTLLQAEAIEIVAEYEPQKGVASTKAALGELYLPLAGLIDVDAERTRLNKEFEKIEAEIAKVERKLTNPNFVQKVPAEVLAEHRQRLEDWQAKKAHVRKSLDGLA